VPLGKEVGLGPGQNVLDGDPAPPAKKKGTVTQFSVHVCCGQAAGWIKMPLGMEVGLKRGDIVLDEDLAPPTRKRAQPPPNFRLISIVAKRLDG